MQIREQKEKYLSLIASGYVEKTALLESGLKKSTYLRLLIEDSDFVKSVEVARKHRAEHWISQIAESTSTIVEKDEVPAERLQFDKFAYLAKADNPERYGGSGKGANININLGEFKLLSVEDAQKALASDPFAVIETTFSAIGTDEDLL